MPAAGASIESSAPYLLWGRAMQLPRPMQGLMQTAAPYCPCFKWQVSCMWREVRVALASTATTCMQACLHRQTVSWALIVACGASTGSPAGHLLYCKLGLQAVIDPLPCPLAATLSAQVAALSARLQAVAGELQEVLSSSAEGQAGAQQLSMVALRLQQDEVRCSTVSAA